MNHPASNAPANPLILIAVFCSFASVGIVALAVCLLREISGPGLFAVAFMAAAPALMGTAMAYFMTKHPSPQVPANE